MLGYPVPMVAMPGLGVRALESYLRFLILNNKRDRDIELEREREREREIPDFKKAFRFL